MTDQNFMNGRGQHKRPYNRRTKSNNTRFDRRNYLSNSFNGGRPKKGYNSPQTLRVIRLKVDMEPLEKQAKEMDDAIAKMAEVERRIKDEMSESAKKPSYVT